MELIAKIIVDSNSARPAGDPNKCFYCDMPIGTHHKTDCVIVLGAEFDNVVPFIWNDIATLPEGQHVLLYWPKGDKGIAAFESATVYWHDGWDGEWSYWTHGSGNAGIDFEPVHSGLKPTMWMKIDFPTNALSAKLAPAPLTSASPGRA